MDQKNKFLALLLVVALCFVGAYWYYAPVLALKSMRAAAEAKDADTFNDFVDYPKLRESLKGQMAALINEKMKTKEDKSGFAAIGNMIGLALIDRMVDAMVRPEMVMEAMKQGKLGGRAGPNPDGAASAAGASHRPVMFESERKGRRYISYVYSSDESREKGIALVLERSGFADWRLTEVRLPTSGP